VIDPDVAQAPTGRRPPWRDLPILIIVIAGLFHFGRGAEVDGLVFVTVGMALVVAELRDRRETPPPKAPPLDKRWILLGALLCLGYGLLVGRWALASAEVILAVAVPGLLILPLAWRVGPPGERGAPRTKWLWAGVMVLICLWELISFLSQPDAQTDSYDHPTLSAILNPMFGHEPFRVVVLTAWLAIGFWLARRLSTAHEEETS
jgi:hypothetical protein